MVTTPAPATETQAPAPATTVLTPLVIIAIVVTILSWASAFIVIRGTGPYFSGGALALGRLAVGALLLGIVFAVGRKKWVLPTGREWLQIIGFGVFWFALYNVALNTAEQSIDAGTAAMIVNIGPILIALGAGLFLREGIPKWLAIGAGVAFVGAVLIGIGTSGGMVAGGVGILWAVVAAVAYAAGVLLQKPTLRRLPNAQVTFLGCAIGFVACLPFTGELLALLPTMPLNAIAGMIYLGVVPTALAYSTWAYALSRMPAGQLGVSTYIVPPLAVLMGIVAFGEIPAVLAVIGGAVCLVGVALSRRRARARVAVALPAEHHRVQAP
jgi:drug/metabolite transporter (DMT)-like permease